MRASLPRIDVSTRSPVAVCAELEQHLHDFRVRAAVQRPFERADRGDDRGVDVGQRGRGDARGERRRVQLVIGVQHQRDVERANRRRVRPLAGQHVEEVCRVAHRRIGRDRSAAGLEPSPRGDERADLRRQPHGLAVLRLR